PVGAAFLSADAGAFHPVLRPALVGGVDSVVGQTVVGNVAAAVHRRSTVQSADALAQRDEAGTAAYIPPLPRQTVDPALEPVALIQYAGGGTGTARWQRPQPAPVGAASGCQFHQRMADVAGQHH